MKASQVTDLQAAIYLTGGLLGHGWQSIALSGLAILCFIGSQLEKRLEK